MTKFKLNLKERIKTKLFWMEFLLLCSLIFGIAYNIWPAHWLYIATFISWVPVLLVLIVAILFAWIINPIQSLIKKIKEKHKDVVD